MRKLIVAIPHSHTWFWTQTCVSQLLKYPPKADGYECEVIVVDNSPWSPAIKGITDTDLFEPNIDILDNYKSNKFHASALDCIVESEDFDLLMALETDVLIQGPDWLEWFVDRLRSTDFAVGHWHHEQFVNPSCTLYRGDVLRDMLSWCEEDAPQDELRWGPDFSQVAPLDNNLPLSENPALVLQNLKYWIGGPFAEKRGWPEGTSLREAPSGQLKGPGWYEPGQQLHHFAVNAGYTYTVCPVSHIEKEPGLPTATVYGVGDWPKDSDAMESVLRVGGAPGMQAVHMWGGTRALDILKHPVTCGFVNKWTPFWLAREARFWRSLVPYDVQKQTLELIRQHGWHITGQGSDHVADRDREAAAFVRQCYKEGGVEW